MVCPNCHHRIAWPKVAYISRWTNLRCQTCKHEWNRKLDLQFWLMAAPDLLGGIGLVDYFGPLIGLPLMGVLLIGITYIDAKTISLVPATTKRASKPNPLA